MAEYIEREALEKMLNERLTYLLDKNGPYDYFTDGYDEAVSTVEEFLAADVAPVVHGRIVGSLEDGRYRRRFSCCGEDATMITQWAWPKYCPNCGAKMDGGADNG